MSLQNFWWRTWQTRPASKSILSNLETWTLPITYLTKNRALSGLKVCSINSFRPYFASFFVYGEFEDSVAIVGGVGTIIRTATSHDIRKMPSSNTYDVLWVWQAFWTFMFYLISNGECTIFAITKCPICHSAQSQVTNFPWNPKMCIFVMQLHSGSNVKVQRLRGKVSFN